MDLAALLFVSLLVCILLIALQRRGAADDARALATSVLVCGATGVGKSTLINTLAGAPVADTSMGLPVTQNTVRIGLPEKRFIFFDSRGLEVAESSQTYLLLLSDLLRLRFSRSPREQIDLVLMCIPDPQNRYDEAHREIAALCDDLRIPYGVAITKWEGGDDLGSHVRSIFSGARFVLPVRSLELRIGDIVIPSMGLAELEFALRQTRPWVASAARDRGRTAMKTESLSAAAREVAATHGRDPHAWVGFGAAAITLLDHEPGKWNSCLIEMRDRVRRHYVPNVFVRNLFTKFDVKRIDSTTASHLIPFIMKRFGDGSRRLRSEDISEAWRLAMYRLEDDRPYRSRF